MEKLKSEVTREKIKIRGTAMTSVYKAGLINSLVSCSFGSLDLLLPILEEDFDILS